MIVIKLKKLLSKNLDFVDSYDNYYNRPLALVKI